LNIAVFAIDDELKEAPPLSSAPGQRGSGDLADKNTL